MIKALYRKELSCDYHRIYMPFQHLDVESTDDINKASVIVYNRIPTIDLMPYKKQGATLIMDIDDYWYLYPEHYLYKHWNPNAYIEALKMADVVTTSTGVLADHIRKINPNVHLIPIGLPFGSGQFKTKKTETVGKFGYVGGGSHIEDIKLIPGLKIPTQHPIDNYMSMYHDINISVAPLVNNEFNKCKSNLKALEAGVNYTALIASDIHPYNQDQGIIKAKPNEWQSKIKYCVDNPNYVQEMGLKLGAHVRRNYNLHEVNKIREQIYSHYLK